LDAMSQWLRPCVGFWGRAGWCRVANFKKSSCAFKKDR
jgi:hypothetical protein